MKQVSIVTRKTGFNAGEQTSASDYIAIVDDDASVRSAMVLLLETYSYRAEAYRTPREFINSLKLKTPSCLITDLQMDGMNGEELQQYLAANGLKIPVIILTGRGGPEVRDRCRKAGAVGFLVKPVKARELLATIEAALGKNESDAPQ